MKSEQPVVLELRGICKNFGALAANKNIDLKVRRGTVHAIIGENGAGKSTLMNIISDIYQADAGDILLNGEKVVFKGPMDACAHGIGMVYQEFMLFPDLTVLDNIMMGFEKRRGGIFIDRKKTRAAIEEICRTYHFNIPLDEKVKGLAVAVLQQVEIVKLLYKGADIIILDEPTSVLTPQGIEGLFDAIRFLVGTGKTVLFITHKLKEVMEISDYITVLKNGEVTGNVRPDEVDEAALASLMVGREVILTAQKVEKQVAAPVLEVKGLHVRDNDGNERVKGVDLAVRAGEIVGVAGVAGSGQKELVEALFGLREAQEGRGLFEGADITSKSCRERRCLGVGYVPQDRLGEGANVEGSIWQNAIMGYHIAHGFKRKLLLDRREIDAFSGQVVKQFAVKTPTLETRVRTLSGGNIQKLIVGREFLQKNKLLIVEDPTRGIDIGAIEFIWKKIIELASEGVGILLVSHELNEVMELSDRIVVMYDGKLFDGGNAGELTEQEIGLLMAGGGTADESGRKRGA